MLFIDNYDSYNFLTTRLTNFANQSILGIHSLIKNGQIKNTSSIDGFYSCPIKSRYNLFTNFLFPRKVKNSPTKVYAVYTDAGALVLSGKTPIFTSNGFMLLNDIHDYIQRMTSRDNYKDNKIKLPMYTSFEKLSKGDLPKDKFTCINNTELLNGTMGNTVSDIDVFCPVFHTIVICNRHVIGDSFIYNKILKNKGEPVSLND